MIEVPSINSPIVEAILSPNVCQWCISPRGRTKKCPDSSVSRRREVEIAIGPLKHSCNTMHGCWCGELTVPGGKCPAVNSVSG